MEFVEYYNRNIDVNRLINHIETTDKKNIKPNGNKLFKFDDFDITTLNWFQECVTDLCKTEYKDINLKITECWGTKTEKFSNHKIHTHPNSIVSGIFYLTDHINSKTIFYEDNPWNWCNSVFTTLTHLETRKTEISSEVGKLILFPSNIKHGTSLHYYDTPRYTISFNTFFSSSFGDFTYQFNSPNIYK